ncbi:hypothetical protein AK812_SmicGene47541, partial [Symbiodinium microadriaticum]
MQKLLAMCSSHRVGTSIRASWVSDLLTRRVQRIYSTWPWAQSIPHWEQFAQDRTQWANHAHWWVRHWVAPDLPVSFELLMERQLIVLSNSKGISDCFLRPSKDFTDVPYSVPMHVIKPAKGGHLLPVFFPKELLQRSVFTGMSPWCSWANQL